MGSRITQFKYEFRIDYSINKKPIWENMTLVKTSITSFQNVISVTRR